MSDDQATVHRYSLPHRLKTFLRSNARVLSLIAHFVLAIIILLKLVSSQPVRNLLEKIMPVRNPSGHLRIALCQYETRMGKIDWNIEHAVEFVTEALENGANLVVLPEFSFISFSDVHDVGRAADDFTESKALERLANLCKRFDAYVLINHPRRSESDVYNESILISPHGREMVSYRKRLRANIDKRVNLAAGQERVVIELPFGNIGFLICKDVKEINSLEDDFEPADVLDPCAVTPGGPEAVAYYSKADLIIVQLAFPSVWKEGLKTPLVPMPISNSHLRNAEIAKDWAQLANAYVLIANKTGLEHGFAFTGNSLVVSPQGELLGSASSGSEVLYVDLPLCADGKLLQQNTSSL